MKILDATTIIAFLSDMKCPDGFTKLSTSHEIIIPKGVADEIKKQPGRDMLRELTIQGTVKIVTVDQSKVSQITREYPQLHRGECEAIVFAQSQEFQSKVCLVSDDSKARKLFYRLHFKWTEELLDIMKRSGMLDAHTYALKRQRLQNSAFYSMKKT